MKNIISLFALFICISLSAQENPKTQTVEAACGQCKFGMTGKAGCDLAVRIDGKPYFVEGTDIHKHGDAHAADGFCSTIRKAEVTGEVKNDKFVATSFKLLPVADAGHTDHTGHKH